MTASMKRTILALALAAASFAAAPAPAAGPDKPAEGEEVRVPFLHLSAFNLFRADGRETLYIRGPGRRWYRVSTMGPCPNLPWAHRIGVDTRGGPTLDRFSILLVDGDRCPVRSVVTADGPPPRRNRR